MANKATRKRNAAVAASIAQVVTDLEILIADIWNSECPDGSEDNELADTLFATRDRLEELAVSVESEQLDACFPKEETCAKTLRPDVVTQRKKLKGRAQARVQQAGPAWRPRHSGVRPVIEDAVCEDLVVGKARAALRGEYDARTISKHDLPAPDDDVDVAVRNPKRIGKARGAKAGR